MASRVAFKSTLKQVNLAKRQQWRSLFLSLFLCKKKNYLFDSISSDWAGEASGHQGESVWQALLDIDR